MRINIKKSFKKKLYLPFIVVALAVFSILNCNIYPIFALSDGTLDSTFSSVDGPDGDIESIVAQSDGKSVIGGAFRYYNGEPANYIARLNSDGTLDSTFGTGIGFDETVTSMAVQSDNKIIVGGWFTSYDEVPANYIARLNSDGTLDSTFNAGDWVNGEIRTIFIQTDGKIIIGGDFSFDEYEGTGANFIARLNSDGTLDTTFSTGTGYDGFDSYVHSIAVQPDGKIIVGGNFGAYSVNDGAETYESYSIARLNSDGSFDDTFVTGAGFDNIVKSIVIQPNGKIIVGGRFTQYDNLPTNFIARLNSDGSFDDTFVTGDGLESWASSIIGQTDGKIIVGGIFSSYNGTATGKITRLDPDGAIDTTFNVGDGFDDGIKSIIIQFNGKVLVVGDFLSYNGAEANKLARLHNVDASIVIDEDDVTIDEDDVTIDEDETVTDKNEAENADGETVTDGKDGLGTAGGRTVIEENKGKTADRRTLAYVKDGAETSDEGVVTYAEHKTETGTGGEVNVKSEGVVDREAPDVAPDDILSTNTVIAIAITVLASTLILLFIYRKKFSNKR